MRVGLLTLTYRLFGLQSLKERRALVKGLLARVRAEGPAFAACEIEPDGGLQRAAVRVAHLSEDAARTISILSRLRERLERGDGFEATSAEVEIL